MTTVMQGAYASAVRCDRCRRLWAITEDEPDSGWLLELEFDVHLCTHCRFHAPLSNTERDLLAADLALAKQSIALARVR